MAAAGPMLAAVGTATKVVGDLRQAKQDSQMADFNAQVAQQNALTVQQQAQENARRSLVNTNKVIGSQRAGFAASGVSGGSVLDVLQDTAAKGALDAATIKNQGDIKAAAYANEFNLNKYRASNSLITGNISAFGDVVGGASKVGGMSSGGGDGGSGAGVS